MTLVTDEANNVASTGVWPSDAGGAATVAVVAGLMATGCGGGGSGTPGASGAQALLSDPNPAYRPELLPRATSALSKRTPTPTELLDWAERQFPGLFSTAATNDTSVSGLVYRYYPGTGHYLGVSGANVLLLGPLTGGKVANVGTLQSFADAVFMQGDAAKPSSDKEAARFLLHAQFSATEADIAALKAQGYEGWLTAQLALPNSQTGWDWLVNKGYAVVDSHGYYLATGTCQYMVWYQLLKSPDAVRRRWAWALSEVFVVSWRGIKDVMNWDSLAMAAYWDLLCKHGFGTYRELIEALTLNPAMGAFLSTRGNMKEDAATGRLPDENYAREVMQLFSIGLHELNLDGTVKTGASGKPVETYTADDVSNLARVFTGYSHDLSAGSFANPQSPSQRIPHFESARSEMVLDAASHSSLAKTFLGVTIPANTPGKTALKIALDTLANHPTTAPFLCRQFIQRLVTSNPSPGYVQRVAQVFNDNGAGVRGDLKAVLKAVLLDADALSAASLGSSTFGKLRSPVLRVAQWGRTFNATSLSGTWKMRLSDWDPAYDIGQYPLDPPSVFSYYRPGYVPPGTAMAAASATAPEFQIVNESTVAGWANFLPGLAYKGVYVRAPELPYDPSAQTPTDGYDIAPDYGIEKQLVTDTQALVDRFNLLMCAGQLSDATVQLIVNALKADKITPDSSDDLKQMHVGRALAFVMCGAEYLVQR